MDVPELGAWADVTTLSPLEDSMLSTKLLASALVLAALCTSATTAKAQDQANDAPRVHQGFWIGGGLGYGSVSSSCDGCGSSDSEGGFSGLLRLGGTLSEQFLIGVESDGWYKSINGTNNSVGNLSAALYYYPSKSTGIFLKGGAGVAGYQAKNGSDKLDGYGVGLIGGLGYDIPIGSHSAFTPMATLTWGNLGELNFNGASSATGAKQTLLQVAFTFSAY